MLPDAEIAPRAWQARPFSALRDQIGGRGESTVRIAAGLLKDIL